MPNFQRIFEIFDLRRHIPTSARSLSVAIFWNSAGFIVYRLSIILSTIIIGRVAGTAGLSTYGIFQISVQNFATFAVLGLSVPVMKYAVLAEDDGKSRDKLSNSVQLFFIMTALTSASYVFIQLFLNNGYDVDIAQICLALLSIIGTALYSFVTAIAIGRKLYRAVSVAMIFGACVVVAGALLYVFYPRTEILFLSYALSSFAIFYYIYRNISGYIFISIFRKFEISHFKEIIFESGIMALISAIVSIVPYLTIRLLEVHDSTSLSTSLFFVGTQLFGLAMLVNSRVAQVIFPLQVENAKDTKHRGAVRREHTLIFGTTAATALTVLPILPLLPLILGLYAPAMVSHSWAISPMIFAAIPAAAMHVIGNTILARNRYITWFYVTLLWGLATIIALVIWLNIALPFAAGAAYATGYATGFAMAYIALRRG